MSRPSKKQKQLLDYINRFVNEHGYGPSYREIMQGCHYQSVATVASHVNNLVAAGHLRKKNRSARSLEVVDSGTLPTTPSNVIKHSEEKWLVNKIEHRFRQAEASSQLSQSEASQLHTLIEALKVLGLNSAASSFHPRLSKINSRYTKDP